LFVGFSVHQVKLSAKMRGFLLALSATLASAASMARDAMPAGAAITPATALEPRGSGKHGHKDKWGCNKPEYRHTVTIRASKNETDDISADLLWAFHKANRGGTVYLKEGSTYVIGKKLDLSFLNDVHLQLDGELKFTDDIEYWQANNFYYDFQKSITWVVWGGEKIKIYTKTGTGVLNGNGQAW
jgi:galacturan 1,4-alpha-galacturonidase